MCVCVCVRALVKTLSDSTSIKEAVICNFDLAYLPCRLHTPPAPIFPKTWRIPRMAEYTASYSIGPGRFFRRVKRPGREADNSLLSSADSKKTCSYTYTNFITSWPTQGKLHLYLHFYLHCTHNIMLQYITLSSR